jgi:hypothetical protein
LDEDGQGVWKDADLEIVPANRFGARLTPAESGDFCERLRRIALEEGEARLDRLEAAVFLARKQADAERVSGDGGDVQFGWLACDEERLAGFLSLGEWDGPVGK